MALLSRWVAADLFAKEIEILQFELSMSRCNVDLWQQVEAVRNRPKSDGAPSPSPHHHACTACNTWPDGGIGAEEERPETTTLHRLAWVMPLPRGTGRLCSATAASPAAFTQGSGQSSPPNHRVPQLDLSLFSRANTTSEHVVE